MGVVHDTNLAFVRVIRAFIRQLYETYPVVHDIIGFERKTFVEIFKNVSTADLTYKLIGKYGGGRYFMNNPLVALNVTGKVSVFFHNVMGCNVFIFDDPITTPFEKGKSQELTSNAMRLIYEAAEGDMGIVVDRINNILENGLEISRLEEWVRKFGYSVHFLETEKEKVCIETLCLMKALIYETKCIDVLSNMKRKRTVYNLNTGEIEYVID